MFVNGFQVDKEYILQEDDICTIRCYPTGVTAVVTGIAIAGAVAVFGVVGNEIVRAFTGKGVLQHLQDFGKWLLGIEDPQETKQREQLEQVPTIKGAKNKSAINTPCPIVLGKSLYTPNYVGSPYTTIGGEDGEDIFFHALYRLGYKDINVSNICLGMTDLASNSENKRNGRLNIDGQYKELEYNTAIEIQQDGEEISFYPQKVHQESLNVELINADGESLTVNRFSAQHPQTVEIEFTVNGLIGYNDQGDKEDRSISISIEESIDGGNTWREFGQITGSNSYESGVSTITRKKAKVMRFVAKKTYSFNDGFIAKNKTVEYRIKRTSAQYTDNRSTDTVYLTAVRTWCYDNEKSKTQGVLVPQIPVAEKDRDKMARLGLFIKGGDAVQGTIEELNCVVSSNARIWNGHFWTESTYETNNPASLALLVLQGVSRGNETVNDSKIDLDQYAEFYSWCENKGFACNGVLYKQQKTSAVLENILSCGRAANVINYNKFGCLVDNDKRNVVMVLNNQNVLEANNSKDFEILPDGYRVVFNNENNYYQQDEMIVCYDGVDKNNPDLVLERIELPYQTNPNQVYKNARYLLACRKLRPEIWNRKMSIDGNLIEIGSLVEVQDDTIVVGIGNGAEITDVIVDGNYVTGIGVDDYFFVEDTSKNYGVKITCADGTNNPRVIKREVQVKDGKQNMFMFETPLALDNVLPSVGDILSFGEFAKITTEAICFGKKDNGDGTFDLTFIPYTADVYNADIGEIPEFESNVTIPSKLAEESIKQPTATKDDVYSNAALVQGMINGNLDVSPTSELKVKSVIAKEKYLEIVLDFEQIGSKNQVKNVKYIISTGKEVIERNSASLSYSYYYNRKTQGYLEKEDFSEWSVSAVVTNIYDKTTEMVTSAIDTEEYGTWKLTKPFVYSQVLDRSVVLRTSLTPRVDNKEIYGNIKYKVAIQRIGNSDIVNTEDYVEPDTEWYQPATNVSWQESEDNYKQGEYVTDVSQWLDCSSTYTQTLPLIGQSNNRMVATVYKYKVVAYNDAGYSEESDEVLVTALPTNIADLVHSNENYKDLYVQRLSAISANVGLISQGGFGSFRTSENYWALSDLSAEDTGIDGGVKKGSFRVGGKNQYIEVKPTVKDGVEDFSVSVKAGNLNFESDKTDIDGRVYAYDRNDPTKKFRTALSDTGVEFQEAITYDENGVGSTYKVNGFVKQSKSGSLFVTNTTPNDPSLPLEKERVGNDVVIYHFDENLNDTNNGNAANLILDGSVVASESPYSSNAFVGTMEIPCSSSCDLLFYTKSNAINVGDLLFTDGTVIKRKPLAEKLGVSENVINFN